LLDKGFGAWSNLTNVGGVSTSSGTGPDGQNVVSIGATSYLDRSDVAWDGVAAGNKMSASVWYKATLPLANTGAWLVSWRLTASPRIMDVTLRTDTPDYARAGCYDDTGYFLGAGQTGASPIGSGWEHLLMTFDEDTIKIYLNGDEKESVTDAAFTDFVTASIPFAIGVPAFAKTSTNLKYQGLMMSPAIWDVALTQAEIDHLYNSGNGRQYADLTII